MKSLRKAIVLVAATSAAFLAAPRHASSEVGGIHLNVTPFVGYGDWAKEMNLKNKVYYGGRLGLAFGRYLGVEGYYSWMATDTQYGIGDSLFFQDGLSSSPSNSIDLKLYGADLVLNLLPSSKLNPYLLGGWHEEKVTADPNVETFMNGAEFGGGVKIGVSPRTAVRLEVRDKLWSFGDDPSIPDPPGSGNNSNLFYNAGLQFSFGGEAGKDADNDGVSDTKDACPNTPAGALVDERGCPLDADGDNVPDGIDQCPNTPHGATVDARGCPSDTDNDGVPDGVDKCPDTPAGTQVDAKGCPADQDGDGVPDGVDQCANTPTGARVDARGCPVDSDNDGVPDGIDQCPNTLPGAQVDARGCAGDSDNDGVTDDKDLCPNTQAGVKVDAQGCPIELTEYQTQLLDKGVITTSELHFESGKADILPESRPVLDEIGKTLIQVPKLRIEIGGHADSRGSDAANMTLTQKRAEAVLDYLVTNFPQLNREQYTAKGYGERKPIASNRTAEGMARNRRVEFKVLNPEELTKERERRRLMQRGE